ncbi:putative sugar phosphate/phosphate translocator, partial [Dissostichus eleginoides]
WPYYFHKREQWIIALRSFFSASPGYLRHFIENASPDVMTNLVKFWTGWEILPRNNLSIEVVNSSFPTALTCYETLRIPGHYKDYASFENCGTGSLRKDSPTTGGRSWVQTAGPSADSAVLQAVTAELAERPSHYGRPCLGGDCGCNLKLRGAGLAIFAKQIENLRCTGPVFAEFNRITSRNLEADFFEALDQHTPRFIQLFKSKKGSTPDVTEQRSVVLKGIPIVLGDDSRDFFKTCFDTTRDEALSSVTVGVLTVLSEDSPQEGPSSIHLKPISISIVLEGGIVMEKIKNFPQAVCLLFGLIYALHLDYPKCMANTLRFVQTVNN